MSSLRLALLTDCFFDAGGEQRLHETLREARASGAELALLPELPVSDWVPITRQQKDEDAEPPGGPRQTLLAAAARRAGVGLVGGAIVRDPETGRRHNTALVYGGGGELLASYRKLHIPQEEGYWEASHYEAGEGEFPVIHDFGLPLGLQICSDINRPQGSHILAALGAQAILVPRATPDEGYELWRTVFRANALTGGCWVVSVNRPEHAEVPIGGPSVVVAPDGSVVLETTESLALVTLSGQAVAKARRDYPGYLDVRADVYERGWGEVTRGGQGL